MSAACQLNSADAGVIRELLTVTRCNVGSFSEAGYRALTGPHSIFPLAVTVLLTIYVAVIGYRLLLGLGAPSLSEIPVIGLKIGTILALTLNWTMFQTLVLDLAARAPTELASAIVGPQYAPLDRLQSAYDGLRTNEAAFAKLAQSDTTGAHANAAEAANELSYASYALLAATGGLLAFATIITGVLASIGPIFVTLFLFETAGGLFAGWVRAIAASAFIPMLCWITTIILLAAIEPRLDILEQQRASASLDAQEAIVTCFIVYVFAAAQFGLVLASAIVAMGFRLPVRRGAAPAMAVPQSVLVQSGPRDSRVDQLIHALHRSSASPSARVYAESAVASYGRDPAPQPSSARPHRLGEDYRRMTDRLGATRR
jgi:type IV secretion system protein VirB6